MINIQFGVRKENLEILVRIIDEVAEYGIWKMFYDEETVSIVEKLNNKINKLNNDYKEPDYKAGIQLKLNFDEGQTLKKIIIYYLNNKFQTLTVKQFETISDFLLFVDDGMVEK